MAEALTRQPTVRSVAVSRRKRGFLREVGVDCVYLDGVAPEGSWARGFDKVGAGMFSEAAAHALRAVPPSVFLVFN
jgi:hypothetical protein